MNVCEKSLFALVSLILAVSGWPNSARAQEAPEDESAYQRAKVALQVPKDLRRAKRKRARQGGWAWTAAANATAGYDSNVHEGPGRQFPGDVSVTGSGVFDINAKLEGLHYFGENDRLKISVESLNHPLTATSSAADYTQRGRFFYAHRLLDRRASISLKGAISHTNDSVTTSRGNTLTRDFENMVYRSTASLRLKIGGNQSASLGYGFKRKDYFETTGLNSLDWWRHGPQAAWSIELSRDLEAQASYRFWMQNYDGEPASFTGGTEFPNNPTEEHFFHTAKFRLRWQLVDWIWFDTKYRFRSKDDRFQKFESYDDHSVGLKAHARVLDAIELEAGGEFHRRDYDHRLGDPTHTLQYDLWRVEGLVRYALTPRLAIYSLYGFDKRDTNRNVGSTYRDYTRHVVSFGATIAY